LLAGSYLKDIYVPLLEKMGKIEDHYGFWQSYDIKPEEEP